LQKPTVTFCDISFIAWNALQLAHLDCVLQTLDDIEGMVNRGEAVGVDPELVNRLKYICGTTAKYLKLA
jgi:hypothetical protein